MIIAEITSSLTALEFAPGALNTKMCIRDRTKVGFKVIQGLRKCGYEGELYPINIKATEVAGIPAYKNINDVPEDVDLAFISLPATGVFDALKAVSYTHLDVYKRQVPAREEPGTSSCPVPASHAAAMHPGPPHEVS